MGRALFLEQHPSHKDSCVQELTGLLAVPPWPYRAGRSLSFQCCDPQEKAKQTGFNQSFGISYKFHLRVNILLLQVNVIIVPTLKIILRY